MEAYVFGDVDKGLFVALDAELEHFDVVEFAEIDVCFLFCFVWFGFRCTIQPR